jgi:hypothetical protein
MTVPTVAPAAVRSTGNQTSTASRTRSPTGTYTDWRRRDGSTITPRILARGFWNAHRHRPLPPISAGHPDPQDYTLDAEGYVALAVSSGRQANSSFNITLWASDGTTTQTETVPVVIQASCKRHY